jgi:hypothetical protein
MVVVIAGSRTALFSPDDVDGFLAAIGSPAAGPVTAAGPGNGSMGKWIGAAIAAVALGAAGFAFLYAPGPPAYTLTADALTIHDRFYPATVKAAEVDVAHARVVDIAADPEWRPTLRTNGIANAHYHSGWFRTASGRRIRSARGTAACR